MEELFKEVYIKTEANLPKESGRYWIREKNSNAFTEVDFDVNDREDIYSWLEFGECYLQPVQQPSEISDEDILEWMRKQDSSQEERSPSYCWILRFYEAMRDGKIKQLCIETEKKEDLNKCDNCPSNQFYLANTARIMDEIEATQEQPEKPESKSTEEIFDIDCNGDMMIQISIKDNTPTVLQAMNGGGEPLKIKEFTINQFKGGK
jgi:hypothetical protein